MASCPRAWSCVPHTDGEQVAEVHLTVSALSARSGVADDGSRWRGPDRNHGFHAVRQNGSAASELAADAHHCIMVRVCGPTEYKDVGTILRATARRLPSTSSSRPHRKWAVVLEAMMRRAWPRATAAPSRERAATDRFAHGLSSAPFQAIVPPCSRPSRTSPSGGADAPSLTAAARDGPGNLRSGRK